MTYSARTDCPGDGDCAVDMTYSARTDCPGDGDCAVDTVLQPKNQLFSCNFHYYSLQPMYFIFNFYQLFYASKLQQVQEHAALTS